MHQITISEWLKKSQTKLREAGIDTHILDSEIILCETLGKADRTYLHAHPELALEDDAIETADRSLGRRQKREPLAYIVGHKEFFGRRFKVTSDTLIPRPESEVIVQVANEIVSKDKVRKVIDVGTGSGILGITVKLENPETKVTLVDISEDALGIARENAETLGADVDIVQSDLLQDIEGGWGLMVANLPYVDEGWDLAPELSYEPRNALFARDSGLELIKNLLRQSREKIPKGGCVVIEADERQHGVIVEFAKQIGFDKLLGEGLILVFRRG